jgi:hypothetical protein
VQQKGKEVGYTRHADFPNLPINTPLTYVLAMKAALSEQPDERPPFSDLLTLLDDTAAEVASGTYINSEGVAVVCPSSLIVF